MTPHTKAATIIAPFLLIGGYIAADFYQSSKEEKLLTNEAQSTAAYELNLASDCRLPEGSCILKKDGLVISVKTDARHFFVESNRELDGVTLGLAQSDRVTQGIVMQRVADSFNWIAPIRQLSNLKADDQLLMRIAMETGQVRYYAEFPISHSGPWGAN